MIKHFGISVLNVIHCRKLLLVRWHLREVVRLPFSSSAFLEQNFFISYYYAIDEDS